MTTTKQVIPPFIHMQLCAIERRLHKWAEDECNGAIQWDDDDCTIPRRYYQDRYGSFTVKGGIISNQESKLLAKAEELAAQCGGKIYHQTDPRGCALYFYRDADLEDRKFPIESIYSSVGIACC